MPSSPAVQIIRPFDHAIVHATYVAGSKTNKLKNGNTVALPEVVADNKGKVTTVNSRKTGVITLSMLDNIFGVQEDITNWGRSNVALNSSPLPRQKVPQHAFVTPTASTFDVAKFSPTRVKNLSGTTDASVSPECASPRKPALERLEDLLSWSPKRDCSDRNFIRENASEVIKGFSPSGRKSVSLAASTRVSTKASPTKTSMLESLYSRGSSLGQVPEYLSRFAQEHQQLIDAEKQRVADEASEGVRHLPEDEKEALIVALKTKWESVNSEYQKLTHVTKFDSLKMKERKEALERQLDDLEKGITTLGSVKHIFVDYNM